MSVRPEESTDAAIILAEMLGNWYTCAESIFLRIRQHFESNVDTTEWHKDLVRKMRTDIPKIRPAVISDETYGNVERFFRYRHPTLLPRVRVELGAAEACRTGGSPRAIASNPPGSQLSAALVRSTQAPLRHPRLAVTTASICVVNPVPRRPGSPWST